jgi:hypothetical protein
MPVDDSKKLIISFANCSFVTEVIIFKMLYFFYCLNPLTFLGVEGAKVVRGLLFSLF